MDSQKNRNLIRRLKTTFIKFEQRSNVTLGLLISALFCFALCSCDPEDRIAGRWVLQEVLKNNEQYNDSTQFHIIPKMTIYEFYYANTLTVKTFANGKYHNSADGFFRFESNKKIFMTFTLLWETYEISADIKKLTNKEMLLEFLENADVYYLKLYAY